MYCALVAVALDRHAIPRYRNTQLDLNCEPQLARGKCTFDSLFPYHTTEGRLFCIRDLVRNAFLCIRAL